MLPEHEEPADSKDDDDRGGNPQQSRLASRDHRLRVPRLRNGARNAGVQASHRASANCRWDSRRTRLLRPWQKPARGPGSRRDRASHLAPPQRRPSEDDSTGLGVARGGSLRRREQHAARVRSLDALHHRGRSVSNRDVGERRRGRRRGALGDAVRIPMPPPGILRIGRLGPLGLFLSSACTPSSAPTSQSGRSSADRPPGPSDSASACG